jgi:hypothetical protein
VAAPALILLFQYAMSWVCVYLGLALKDDKTADNPASLIFPFKMIANTFVPTSACPHGCAPWAAGTQSAPSLRPAASCSATLRVSS